MGAVQILRRLWRLFRRVLAIPPTWDAAYVTGSVSWSVLHPCGRMPKLGV